MVAKKKGMFTLFVYEKNEPHFYNTINLGTKILVGQNKYRSY